ncbi:MAG: DEAD/DEAH box helicase, partial [Phycisphaerales bacterium]|nr:DEAD/DEAH box helicase [Phycisphaerales bacterium]
QAAIVLVPEISLTPQTAGRFVERFRDVGVAVLHSGLSSSQRHKEWARAGSGAARVVVGARSAIFAPLEKVGLIVVDEEHASDYKQDQLPRYHGRDVAIKRAQMFNCPVILGSATPSLESWVNAGGGDRVSGLDPTRHPRPEARDPLPTRDPKPETRSSKYSLWQLKSRIGDAVLPKVEIVDLAEERKLRRHLTRTQNAHLHLLGPTLEKAIADTLEDDATGQVLLLLNRRGYSSYIACPVATCGWVMVCDDCDAKMVQHRVIAGGHSRKGVVRCHHCLAQKLLPEACPVCTARTIALGLGTQRIEHELAQKFAHLLGGEPRVAGTVPAIDIGLASEPSLEAWTLPPGMARVDGDTMGSAKDYFDTLTRFAAGELRLLVGTQMIAKGLDFPNVRLVGVINADSALSLPDFRAAERTFQLVAQVAGRAGRGGLPGRVVVQTMDPSAPSIVHAASHDFESFAEEELASRRQAGLPPASRMARIVCRDEDLAKVTSHAGEVASALREALAMRDEKTASTTSIIGPAPCPVSRIGGFHRLEILITSPARMAIQSLLADLRGRGLLVSDAHTAIDIDPIALM